MKRLWGVILVIGGLLWVQTANASADSTCYPSWKIKQTDRSGCSSTALIGPGNDTRVNLLMLLYDRHKAVGAITLISDNADGRRGEAEPFDYPVFALALATPATNEQGEQDASELYGTRCMSNLSGSADFIGALDMSQKIPAGERATLAAVRTMLTPGCIDAEQSRATAEQGVILVKSKEGKNFARYLVGAAAFYDGDFAQAQAAFASVTKADSPWLVGSTAYMKGRTALNQATMEMFDEYGSLKDDASTTPALRDAEGAFLAYLNDDPRGQYAASARGLLRRIYWLGKNRDSLVAEYVGQFAATDAASRNVSLADLVQEMDIKVLDELDPSMVRDPMLLAVLDLKAMRHDGDPKMADYDGPPISRAALAKQRDRFAGNEALYGYVLAAHSFYVANDPADVLRLIRPVSLSGNNSYLEYSRQLLRALALDATGDPGGRTALIGLISSAKHPFQRGATELALAMNEERSKNAARIFATGSPVRDPDLREIILRYHAGPALLRARAADKAAPTRERQVALYALLYKQLTRGAYEDFIRDLAMIPMGAKPLGPDDYETPRYVDVAIFKWQGSRDFSCPPIRDVASTLSGAPKDSTSLLCIGEFIRLNGLDPDYYGVVHYLDDAPPGNELGGASSLFPGKRFSRLDGYKVIIADPKSGADNKAYALYRAVNCFAPSGNNGCDGVETPNAQRKAWYQRLKTDFPTSPWARKLKYYW